MAITETKIIQVENDPSIINAANEEWGKFGWSVLNIQITHSQDTKTYTKGLDYYTGDKTVETTTINYATITYQRDKTMANYHKIAELEQQYLQIENELSSLHAQKPKDGAPFNKVYFIILIILCWPAAIIYYVIKKNQKKEANNPATATLNSKITTLNQQQVAIAAEAATLMESACNS